MQTMNNYNDMTKRAFKYILFSIILFITIKCIPNENNINVLKIVTICMISYTILDLFVPNVSINNNTIKK